MDLCTHFLEWDSGPKCFDRITTNLHRAGCNKRFIEGRWEEDQMEHKQQLSCLLGYDIFWDVSTFNTLHASKTKLQREMKQ